jgi:hypothetical protein
VRQPRLPSALQQLASCGAQGLYAAQHGLVHALPGERPKCAACPTRVLRLGGPPRTLWAGANINKSLLALGNCINALGKQQKNGVAYVPYRNSKLTR